MATWQSAGKVRMTPKGTWSASVAYEVLDLVVDANAEKSYLAKTNVPAGTPLTNASYWDVTSDVSGVINAFNTKSEAQLEVDRERVNQVIEESANAIAQMQDYTNEYSTRVHGETGHASGDLIVVTPDAGSLLRPKTIFEVAQEGEGDPYPGGGRNNIAKSIISTGDTSIWGVSLFIDADLKPSTTYTISFIGTAGNSVLLNDGITDDSYWIGIKGERESFTFTTKSAVSVDDYRQYTSGKGWIIFKNTRELSTPTVFTDIQLELGSTATPYAPYANIRPISGWTGAKLTRCGKNLWNGKISYEESGTPDLCGYTDPITIAVKFVSGTSQFNYRLIYTDGTDMSFMFAPAGFENGVWRSVNISPEKPLRSIHFTSIDTATTRSVDKIMVMFGTHSVTDEIYEPPQTVEEFSAEFGQTVCSGTLDWQTGVLTVDRALVTLTGAETYNNYSSWANSGCCVVDAMPGAVEVPGYGIVADLICSHAPIDTVNKITATSGLIAVGQAYANLYISLGTEDKASLKSYLAAQYAAGTPVQVAYKLAAPIIIQLTPYQILALDTECENYIFGDANIELDYIKPLSVNSKKIFALMKSCTDVVEKNGNPVSCEMIEGFDIEKLETRLLPIQEGKGDPYPAGGGKNLLNLTIPSLDAVIVQNADGTITVTNNTGGVIVGARCELTGILPSGTYTISKNDTSADVFLQQNGSEDYSNNITTYTFNYDGVSYLRVLCSNIQNGSSVTYKIQLEKGSTATEYAPYSNIRPISGRTGAKLTRCGKNLLNLLAIPDIKDRDYSFDPISGVYRIASLPANIANRWVVKVPSNTDMCMHVDAITDNGIVEAGLFLQGDATTAFCILTNGAKTAVFNTGNHTEITISIYTSAEIELVINGAQLELSSTASAYEPYQSNTYAADFGQTVYGGKLDWQTGVLAVEWAMLTLGQESNIASNRAFIQKSSTVQFSVVCQNAIPATEHIISSAFPSASFNWNEDFVSVAVMSENRIDIAMSKSILTQYGFDDGTDYAKDTTAFKAWLADMTAAGTPVQVAYKLATPTTIQLTPQQIKLPSQEIKALQGTNVFYGDGITNVKFRQPKHIALEDRITALENIVLSLATS